jgi:F-type H+-transporting ATPase subunit a
MLAEFNLLEHLNDHPWPGCSTTLFGMPITLMSSAIAAIILVGIVLIAVILPAARRRQTVPHGMGNVLEVVVLFIRDSVARPTLHDKAYTFLPYLVTIFVYVLGMNLLGLIPLEPVCEALGLPKVGVRPTGVISVTAALASITLVTILFLGLRHQTTELRHKTHLPWILCAIFSPILWVKSLSPHIPGVIGKILLVPMALLELIGAFMKCFALMIRLFANMMAGHALLAVLLMFTIQAFEAYLKNSVLTVFYVGPTCVIASVLVDLLELLVAVLQAYIFTFLTSMFISMYVEPSH